MWGSGRQLGGGRGVKRIEWKSKKKKKGKKENIHQMPMFENYCFSFNILIPTAFPWEKVFVSTAHSKLIKGMLLKQSLHSDVGEGVIYTSVLSKVTEQSFVFIREAKKCRLLPSFSMLEKHLITEIPYSNIDRMQFQMLS